MNKFSEKLAEVLTPIASKIASQKYLIAIREAFIAVMPLVIVASFFVLINNVLLDSTNGYLRSLGNFDAYKAIGGSVYNATMGLLSIFIAYGMAYKLAEYYEMEDKFGTGFVSIAATVTLMPAVDGSLTGASGLFVAMIVSLISTELLRVMQKTDLLKIKMPSSVPASISRSFNLLIPTTITLTLFGVLAFALVNLTGLNAYEIITNVIQKPIQAVFQGLPGIIIVVLIQSLLWSLGLHGGVILSPIIEPTLLAAIDENMAALAAGQAIPNIVTKPFLDCFVNMGGVGTCIGLIIALLIFSKKKSDKTISKLGFAPGCFNINEPIMYGLPVVLNPIYIIPLIIVPVVNLVIAYMATSMEFVARTTVMVPWTTPPILSGFLATNGDWRAAVLSIILIVVAIVIYMPFIIVANKMQGEDA